MRGYRKEAGWEVGWGGQQEEEQQWESYVVSEGEQLEKTGEAQQIRSTTKRIVCLSECLAVSSAKPYWFLPHAVYLQGEVSWGGRQERVPPLLFRSQPKRAAPFVLLIQPCQEAEVWDEATIFYYTLITSKGPLWFKNWLYQCFVTMNSCVQSVSSYASIIPTIASNDKYRNKNLQWKQLNFKKISQIQRPRDTRNCSENSASGPQKLH